jgi:hypothetical protein
VAHLWINCYAGRFPDEAEESVEDPDDEVEVTIVDTEPAEEG